MSSLISRCCVITVAALLVPAAAAAQESSGQEWRDLPVMKLERTFAGPLSDTIIQRWRDPDNGAVCYIYLPITVRHSPRGETGFVQYGANGIGNISCLRPKGD